MPFGVNGIGYKTLTSTYLQKIMACELTQKRNSAYLDNFARGLFEAKAKVKLNHYHADAALLAFFLTLNKGVILADVVDLDKAIKATIVISPKWAERQRHILIAPATLHKQLSKELTEKFYLPIIILEARNFNRILNDTYPNTFYTTELIVICSYPYVRQNTENHNVL